MIKKIRVMLEYSTYCLWLYDENDEIIDNNNPPEWDDDTELTDAFMAVNDLYDTFFVDNEKEFSYIGCSNTETKLKLKELLSKAMAILLQKNNNKYIIQCDVDIDGLNVREQAGD